jgi:hypothetical protein
MINPRIYTYVVARWSFYDGLTQRIVEATSLDMAIRDAAHEDGWEVDYSVPVETLLDSIEDHYFATNVTP